MYRQVRLLRCNAIINRSSCEGLTTSELAHGQGQLTPLAAD